MSCFDEWLQISEPAMSDDQQKWREIEREGGKGGGEVSGTYVLSERVDDEDNDDTYVCNLLRYSICWHCCWCTHGRNTVKFIAKGMAEMLNVS